MPNLNRRDWLENNGFRRDRDPFSSDLCAEENVFLFLQDDDSFLIEPPFYQEIRGSDKDSGPRFIFAASGGGKTTIKELIQRDLDKRLNDNGPQEKTLAVVYDDFDLTISKAGYSKNGLTPLHHVEQIITLVLEKLLEIAGEKKHADRLKCLQRRDTKELLARYVKDFGSFHPFQRKRLLKNIKGLRQSVNREQSIALFATFLDVLSDALSPPLIQRIGKFVSLALGRMKDDSIATIISGYRLLEDVTEVCRQFGLEKIYVLIDNVDDAYFIDAVSSLEASLHLARSLATYGKLLRVPGLVFKFFLPLHIYQEFKQLINLGGFGVRSLTWDRNACERIYQQRLKACWGIDPGERRDRYSLSKLCDRDLGLMVDDAIVEFGAKKNSPRAMVILGNELLAEHFRFGFREKDDKISTETWNRALQRAQEVLS